jgi:hypothetical protein
MGAIRLVEKWTGISFRVPHWLMAAGGIGALFMAQWDAYKAVLAGKTRHIKTLSALIMEGQEIRYRCPWPITRHDYTKEREKHWMEEWNAWAMKVQVCLEKQMTLQALTKFQHTTGIEEIWSVAAIPTSQCPLFDRQIQNLVDILDNLDSYA